MLAEYITQTQDFLNDTQGQFFSVPRITNYINRSRRRVAAASGCLRVMPPGTLTIPNQETYKFSDWKSLVQGQMKGVDSILACRSLSISIGGKWREGAIRGGAWKPTWRRIPWTDFQARFRIYGRTFIGTLSEPGWWAQYGLGPLGVIYLAPIPSQENIMEWDCSVIPQPLTSDDDAEAIPYPWIDVIPYFAAVMALLGQQRLQDAQLMMQLVNTDLPFAASVVNPQVIQNPYAAGIMRSA